MGVAVNTKCVENLGKRRSVAVKRDVAFRINAVNELSLGEAIFKLDLYFSQLFLEIFLENFK